MIPTLIEPAHAGRTAPIRVLMLPAAYAEPSDFIRHGFVRAIRDRSLEVDVVFAGFELQEVSDRSVFRRLREEILLPAYALGCAVWMGGISLGGYLALGYAERYPGELAGLCLFAPYLGSHLVTSEIERANGLESWRPGQFPEDDDERRVWRFIRTLRAGALPLHLGLGREDRFGRRHSLMAAALAPESVDVVPGGHDWPTWRSLWDRFLDARLVPNAAAGHPTG
ncbi:MAG TPA: alpha/beta hydrolase-fold protein [Steroidobacteraceae bacterium]|nr:alpha/beta hydrolase-fold protein [Steroidobacteraceae bacterium]